MQGLFFNPPLDNNYWGHILKEIYLDRIYAPYVEGKKDLTILECGGNLGLTAYYFSFFAKKVISLEPDPEHAKVFRHMVEFNKLDNVKLIEKAIDIENGTKPFYRNTNLTMNSLNSAVFDNSSPTIDVTCVNFEQLFEDEKLDHVDILKVDVEGIEGSLFANSSFQKVAPKIDLVMGEAHAWDTRSRNQLSEALKMAGYQVSTMPSAADIFVGRRPK
jgi:FkbM family methyltransferase